MRQRMESTTILSLIPITTLSETHRRIMDIPLVLIPSMIPQICTHNVELRVFPDHSVVSANSIRDFIKCVLEGAFIPFFVHEFSQASKVRNFHNHWKVRHANLKRGKCTINRYIDILLDNTMYIYYHGFK